MTESAEAAKIDFPDTHQDVYSKTILGFWIYLMADCIIFATLFTAYLVLHKDTFGGLTPHELFSLPVTMIETIVLLVSTVACGFGMVAAVRNKKNHLIGWFSIAFLMGLTFVGIELTEFRHLIKEGNSWQRSGFLSSFFTLVGTHGLHVSIGLLWMLILGIQIFFQGINVTTFRRLVCFAMFWHFLDWIWVFIFSFVYLMGVI